MRWKFVVTFEQGEHCRQYFDVDDQFSEDLRYAQRFTLRKQADDLLERVKSTTAERFHENLFVRKVFI